MTTTESTSRLGDFTIFGFATDPERCSKRELDTRLGITPRIIDFGTVGHLFFYTSYGEVAESEESIALKLGFLRSPAKSPLSAKELLVDKIVMPGAVDVEAFRGNALVACFSKTEPVFSAFKTLIAIPQLYYATLSGGEIICSDRLNCLLGMMDQIEFDEDVLPMHFMFRSVPGAFTYFRNVKRMLPGQLFKWTGRELSIKLTRDLQFPDRSLSFKRVDNRSLDALYQVLHEVVGDYVSQIEASGCGLANLLSGGVDSSLIQFLINQQSSKSSSRSISYAARAPSFEFEIENARRASQLFHTQHNCRRNCGGIKTVRSSTGLADH